MNKDRLNFEIDLNESQKSGNQEQIKQDSEIQLDQDENIMINQKNKNKHIILFENELQEEQKQNWKKEKEDQKDQKDEKDEQDEKDQKDQKKSGQKSVGSMDEEKNVENFIFKEQNDKNNKAQKLQIYLDQEQVQNKQEQNKQDFRSKQQKKEIQDDDNRKKTDKFGAYQLGQSEFKSHQEKENVIIQKKEMKAVIPIKVAPKQQINDNYSHYNIQNQQEVQSQQISSPTKFKLERNLQNDSTKSMSKNDKINYYQSDPDQTNHQLKICSKLQFSMSAKELRSSLRFQSCLKMHLSNISTGWKYYVWPEFEARGYQSNQFILSCQMKLLKPTTFLVSSTRDNFAQNSSFYCGKMKSNLLGDVLNIYSSGLSYNQAFKAKTIPRQLLATIVFATDYLAGGKPRDFKVYIKKEQFNYFQDFDGVSMYESVVPLNLLFKNERNQNKIRVYQNRKPIWNASLKKYTLDFQNRVKKASIKNFILHEIQNSSKQAMVFGKLDENQYYLEISHPLSPFVGFCIAMSSFDMKIAFD